MRRRKENELDDIRRAYIMGYKDGQDDAKAKDACSNHGAWLVQGVVKIGSMVIALCDQCDEYGVVASFCMNCGADMRGENDEPQKRR